MGLFSRNESAPAPGRRSSLSSEAQVNELRGRARRRLIGALVLVLAAVIVVPMLFDSTEPTEQAVAPLVVPAIVAPTSADSTIAAAVQPADSGASGIISQTPQPPEPAQAVESHPSTEIATAQTTPPPAPEPQAVKPPEPKPAKKEEPKPKEPKPSVERTDDGSVAIALLEGRTPTRPAPAASGSGNFILQIAAYTNDKDAQVRRDRLVSAGVTNAYVENASSGGKATYRLRVGPFPTRDAAQAAQARLRALGYDNGFISTK
jgi:DedD protein